MYTYKKVQSYKLGGILIHDFPIKGRVVAMFDTYGLVTINFNSFWRNRKRITEKKNPK